MIEKDKVLVLDIDGTICGAPQVVGDYSSCSPNSDIVQKVREYKEKGFYIIFYTSRNMNTHDGNIGKINARTLKVIVEWLDLHHVPYDEIHVGKPWPGKRGFYVDDRAVRPSEFLEKSYDEIRELTGDGPCTL